MSVATMRDLEEVHALPATAFEAMVVASAGVRRGAVVAMLRQLGARDVLEADSLERARALSVQPCSRDVVVVDGYLVDGTALQALRVLAEAGWQRALLTTVRDDARAVRVALEFGVRNYVVLPEIEGSVLALMPRTERQTPSGARLTPREVQVLQMVADGQSNKEVGLALGMSGLTVKSHLSRIAHKLLTGDRAELVAIGMRNGWVR